MGKEQLRIDTPQGSVYQYIGKNGKVSVKLEWSPSFGREMTDTFQTGQAKFDSEFMRYMEPYMHKDTGMMIASMKVSTVLGDGLIVVDTPYARRRYYELTAQKGLRGPYYFDRMVADKRLQLLNAAKRFLGVK